MENLKQGDYVTNLTEEQFDELNVIFDSFLCWNVSKANSRYFIPMSIIYRLNTIFHTNKKSGITKLPFEVFKQRAINTFKG